MPHQFFRYFESLKFSQTWRTFIWEPFLAGMDHTLVHTSWKISVCKPRVYPQNINVNEMIMQSFYMPNVCRTPFSLSIINDAAREKKIWWGSFTHCFSFFIYMQTLWNDKGLLSYIGHFISAKIINWSFMRKESKISFQSYGGISHTSAFQLSSS